MQIGIQDEDFATAKSLAKPSKSLGTFKKKKTSSKQKITGPNTIPVFIHHAVHILDMYKRMSVQKSSGATSVTSVCLGCSVLPAPNGSVRFSLAGPLVLGKITLFFL